MNDCDFISGRTLTRALISGRPHARPKVGATIAVLPDGQVRSEGQRDALAAAGAVDSPLPLAPLALFSAPLRQGTASTQWGSVCHVTSYHQVSMSIGIKLMTTPKFTDVLTVYHS